MSEPTTIAVPVLAVGQLMRWKTAEVYGRFVRYHPTVPGWGVVRRGDGVLDVGPLSNWEAVKESDA